MGEPCVALCSIARPRCWQRWLLQCQRSRLRQTSHCPDRQVLSLTSRSRPTRHFPDRQALSLTSSKPQLLLHCRPSRRHFQCIRPSLERTATLNHVGQFTLITDDIYPIVTIVTIGSERSLHGEFLFTDAATSNTPTQYGTHHVRLECESIIIVHLTGIESGIGRRLTATGVATTRRGAHGDKSGIIGGLRRPSATATLDQRMPIHVSNT